MSEHIGLLRSTLLAFTLLGACSDAPYEPTPERLIGEFSGQAGEGLQAYGLFLALDQVEDSVRGLWSLSFQATCTSHDGPFSGIIDGNELRFRLRPDEDYEATLDLRVRVLPGDSVLTGSLTLWNRAACRQGRRHSAVPTNSPRSLCIMARWLACRSAADAACGLTRACCRRRARA